MTHACVRKLNQFRICHAACSVPSHYLNKCWFVISWDLRNVMKLLSKCNNSHWRKWISKVVCKVSALLSRRWRSSSNQVFPGISPFLTGFTFVFFGPHYVLTHWGRVTHICVSKIIIIGSDNGLSPGRRQAIIWTNARILLIGLLGIKLGEILIEIHTFSFKKMLLKMTSGKWRPFCLGLNVWNWNEMQLDLIQLHSLSRHSKNH